MLWPPHGIDGYDIPVAGAVSGAGGSPLTSKWPTSVSGTPSDSTTWPRDGAVHGYPHRAAAATWPQEQPQLSGDNHERLRLIHLLGMPGEEGPSHNNPNGKAVTPDGAPTAGPDSG